MKLLRAVNVTIYNGAIEGISLRAHFIPEHVKIMAHIDTKGLLNKGEKMEAHVRQCKEYFDELWQKHRVLIFFLIFGFLFDTLSTIHFMIHDGIYLESHPMVRYSALYFGPVAGTILSAFLYKAITSIFLAMYLKPIRIWILLLPAITSTFAGFYNFYLAG